MWTVCLEVSQSSHGIVSNLCTFLLWGFLSGLKLVQTYRSSHRWEHFAFLSYKTNTFHVVVGMFSTVIDQWRRQTLVRISVVHPLHLSCHFFVLYHILSSFLIYCWTDAQQQWILNTILSISVSGNYKYCNGSFIFSLVNPSGTGPTKLPLKPDQTKYGIYCNGGYGPTFGSSHDLTICNEANSATNSYSSLGSTYECPPHITPSTFLTGNKNFTASELEVFGLKQWA